MFNRSISVLALFFICFSYVQAQPDRATGLIFDPEAFNRLESVPTWFGGNGEDLGNGEKSENLPFSASLKDFVPPVGNQGNIGSCVGWASGYYALSTQIARIKNLSGENIRRYARSALFIYNQIKNIDCGGGSTLESCGKFLKTNGDCANLDFDSPPDDCNRLPDEQLRTLAKAFAIQEYNALFGRNTDAKVKIFKTKKMLANNIPVVIGMAIRHNFNNPSGLYWNPDEGDIRDYGGHALCVIGYDDRRQAFNIVNSWGTEWGNEGYIWVKYQDFARFAFFGYIFLAQENIPNLYEPDQPESPDLISLRGKFLFRYPDWEQSSTDTIAFHYVEPIYAGGHFYSLKKNDWKINDQFQLVIKGMQAKKYVYVFSVDAEGYTVHWPRQVSFAGAFKSNETPLIPFDKVEIVIPDALSALTRRVSGDDNICILYSEREILDFKNRLDRLQGSSGRSFGEKFTLVFQDLLIPASEIKYEKNAMSFSVQSASGKPLVPIVLRVQGE